MSGQYSWGVEVSPLAQAIPGSQPYAKPKKMSTRRILQSRFFCNTCEEIQTPVSYCVGTRTVELSCRHFRSL